MMIDVIDVDVVVDDDDVDDDLEIVLKGCFHPFFTVESAPPGGYRHAAKLCLLTSEGAWRNPLGMVVQKSGEKTTWDGAKTL